MADISAQIRAIQQASRGEDVRDAIVSALNTINGSIIDEQAITNAINALDVAATGGNGKYIKSISEENGKISAAEDTLDTQPTQNSAKPITSGAVYSLKSTLESNFQAGVDSIYDAVVAKGSTPASHSLSDVIQGIEDISTGGGSGNSIDEWDFTSSYIGTIRNLEATHSTNTTRTSEGVIFNDASDYVKLPLMYDGLTIEIDIGEMTLPSLSSHQRFIMSTAEKGFIYRSTGYWAFYNGSWVDSSESDRSFFNNSTLKIKIDSDGIWSIYKNDVLWWSPSLALKIDTSSIMIGSSGGQSITSAKISGARIY